MKFFGIHGGHNACAALIVDGVVEFAIQEERLVRQKNFYAFPQKSIESTLAFGDCSADDIDKVVFASKYIGPGASKSEIVASFKAQRKLSSFVKRMIVTTPAYRQYANRRSQAHRVQSIEVFGFNESRIEFLDYHLCHASAAYFGLYEDFAKRYSCFDA